MKICLGCKKELPFDLFFTRKDRINQYSSRCKSCTYLLRKTRHNYTEYYRIYMRTYSKTNKYKNRMKAYKETSEIYKAYVKSYRKTDTYKKYRAEYARRQRKINKDFCLTAKVRSRIKDVIQNNKLLNHRLKDIGCTLQVLKRHIENQFVDGMSWGNRKLWHIDHIKPLSDFNLRVRKQYLLASHYTNLQPLWIADNIKKGIGELKRWRESK